MSELIVDVVAPAVVRGLVALGRLLTWPLRRLVRGSGPACLLVAAALVAALTACNPYGMQYGVRCPGGALEVEARNPTGEAWDWRTDLDGTWHLSRPGTSTVVPQRSAPARITITTAAPSGQPDAVETLATGC